MEHLPLEVLEAICEYIGNSEPRRPSLLAFALTSRRCHAASIRERFSRVSIKAQNAQQLEAELVQINCAFSALNATRHIRKLKITGNIPYTRSNDDDSESSEECYTQFRTRRGAEDSYDPFADLQTSPPPYSAPLRYVPSAEQESRRLASWEPLASFISGLALTDLIWASSDQVPPSILSALHALSAPCRLHIQRFHFPSLIYRIDEPKEFDEHERAIATSPCLYSLSLSGSKWESRGAINYNYEVVIQMASGFAPNLRQVYISSVRAKDSPEGRRAHAAGRPPWLGFQQSADSGAADVPAKSKGKLRTLHLGNASPTYWTEICAWEDHVDFRALEELKIPFQKDSIATLKKLLQLAQDGSLGSLRRLKLYCRDGHRMRREHERDADYDIMRFISALPVLERLEMSGAICQDTWDAARKRHGEAVVS